MVSEDSGRRRFIRRLATLGAAGGIATLLYGRVNEKPLIQPAQAQYQSIQIDQTNLGNSTTELDSDLANDAVFKAIATKTLGGWSRGLFGESDSVAGIGVEGYAFSFSGSTQGVRGVSDSTEGTGVYGLADNLSGTSYGVYGESTLSSDGVGVEGKGSVGVRGRSHIASSKAIVAQGASGQIASLQEWRDSDGNALSVVDKEGKLGIGTNSPGYRLQIGNVGQTDASMVLATEGPIVSVGAGADNQKAVVVQGLSGGAAGGHAKISAYDYQAGTGLPLAINPNNSDVYMVQNGGKVGIGTTSPVGILHSVASSSSTNPIIAQAASGQTANLQEWQDSGGNVLSAVDSSGYLGVGGSGSYTTGGGVQIQGTGTSDGSSSDLGLRINNTTELGNEWFIDSTGSNGIQGGNARVSPYGFGKLAFVTPVGGTPTMTLTPDSVGIGTTSPLVPLHIKSASSNPAIRIENENSHVGEFIYCYSNGNIPFFSGRRARGTMTSPSAVQTDDTLMRYGGSGYGSTGFPGGNRAILEFRAAETWTDSTQGTYITISTTPTGSNVAAERVRIKSDGNIGIGSTTPSSRLHVTSDSIMTGETGVTVDIPRIGTRRIIVGAADSAGLGYRSLKVAN